MDPVIAYEDLVTSQQHRMVMTQASVARLGAPVHGRLMVHDTKLPGLAVRVTPAGTKSLVLYRWIKYRPQIVTLGRFPALSVEQARQIVQRMNGQIADQVNPMQERRAAREELTFGELFYEYLERHAKPRKRTWESDVTRYRLYLEKWANRRVTEIRRLDVHALHARIAQDRGSYTANRLLSLISVIFNLGRTWGLLDVENPVKGIARYKEQSRERFLLPNELPRFFEALMTETNTDIRDYVLLSLFTGARRSNVLGMRWADVDLESARWTIPAEASKNFEEMIVPLSPQAVALIESRRSSTSGLWVLPGRGTAKHLQWPRNGWVRIVQRAGLTNLRLHDLRRTLGSWQAAAGANLLVIGKSLGHKSLSTTAIYSRLSLDPVRASVNTAVSNMLSAAGVSPQAFVGPAVETPVSASK